MSKNGTIVIVEDDDDQRSNYENLLSRRFLHRPRFCHQS